MDIIKSGGYKISALDVERELLSLSVIEEAAVVSLEDKEWGQRVAAIVTLMSDTKELNLKHMRNMLRKNMAPYKIPTVLKVVDKIPRNKMGKGNPFTWAKSDYSEQKATCNRCIQKRGGSSEVISMDLL